MQNIDVLAQGLVTGINGLMNPNPVMNAGVNTATSSGGSQTPPKSSDLVFATFNQDTTSLAVGTNGGYKLYSLSSTDTLDPIYESATEGVYIAERLFSSSLVAIVTQSSPRKLRVCHFKKGTEICNYSYTSKILAVKMNRARLVVCLEESLFIHNIRDMKVLHTIRETPSNRGGLCSLSTDSDNCYLAYPGHSSVGELQIFDALNLASISMIPAHTGQLAAIQFNPTGTRVATASDKGTVIRVFNVGDGARLYELRRGLKRTAAIYSLSFSPCGLYLACSSNTETVHVFKLDEVAHLAGGTAADPGSPPGIPNQGAAGQGAGDGSWMGCLSNVVSVSANYLPTQVTDTLLQGRAFATVHHNLYGLKNVCALAVIKKTLRLLLTSDNGYLYIYSLDTSEGGDCHLIRQFHLTSDGQQVSPAQSSPLSNRPVKVEEEILGGASSPTSEGESEKFHEMSVATETPPKQCFLLDDDGDFPPVGSPSQEGNASSPPR